MNEPKLLTEIEADKNTCVFAGMWRPPFPQVLKSVSIIPALLGDEDAMTGSLDALGQPRGGFRTIQQARTRWLSGDFDSPLYRRVV